MTWQHRTKRSGHTLPELVVSLSVATILMGGLFSTLLIASKTIDPHMASSEMVPAARVASRILAELQLAIVFDERSPTSVTFQVADRDGDQSPESIRYSWSGRVGDPLIRVYNGGASRIVLESVHDFQLGYDVRMVDSGSTVTSLPHFYLYGVQLAIQPAAQAATRIDGSTEVRDRPEVPSV